MSARAWPAQWTSNGYQYDKIKPRSLSEMTCKTDTREQTADWRNAQRRTLTRVNQLSSMRPMPAAVAESTARAHALFPVRIPPAFAELIDFDCSDDPLLRQVWPAADELRPAPGFDTDPVGEMDARQHGGVVHRYANRALLITTGACAINCRYCFRRHFPYGDSIPGDWSEPVSWLQARPQVNELILSGGDPLMLPTKKLAQLTRALSEVGHLRRLRIHSRMPLVAPERVDEELLDWLNGLPWPVAFVIHCNHASEIGSHGGEVLQRLAKTVHSLMNQSVLLAGVNDSVETLCALSERLFDHRVLPYYLHQLDPVAGAAHFQVDDGRARELHRQLRLRLPGYLVPRLVRDQPGSGAKMPL